jgi:hypothetical protein
MTFSKIPLHVQLMRKRFQAEREFGTGSSIARQFVSLEKFPGLKP